MSMTDPVADMLTRIRNGNRVKLESVDMPSSKMKVGIARVLLREGYIKAYREIEAEPRNLLRVYLKYTREGEKAIRVIRRVSKPGRRVYTSVKDLAPVLEGLGISILSTPNGILSNRECRGRQVGGEVLCSVW